MDAIPGSNRVIWFPNRHKRWRNAAETPCNLVKSITSSYGSRFERGFFQMVHNHSGYTVQGEILEFNILENKKIQNTQYINRTKLHAHHTPLRIK